MTQKIASTTKIGEIELYVADLNRSIEFYQKGLGFRLLNRTNGQAVMGAGENRLLTLVERPGAKQVKGVTGLYHFAVLLPDRGSLALLLYHLAESEIEIQGAADHGVSEALYLDDPDGNGIELYRDRKRSEWPVDDIGKLQMGTDPLDVDDLVMELRGGVPEWTGLPDKTVIGHVHLRVRNIPEAEQFYTGVLGFQVMDRYGAAAIFVSAGGYHHHIGMNTWAGVGAPPPPPDAAGLRWFEVRLPDQKALESVQARLKEAGVALEEHNDGFLVRDPSQNTILLVA